MIIMLMIIVIIIIRILFISRLFIIIVLLLILLLLFLWGGLGVDGRTILEWTLKRSMLVIGLIRLRIGIIGEPL